MRVLAAVDGSPGSLVAAGYGALLASTCGGSLVLAHAMESAGQLRGQAVTPAEFAQAGLAQRREDAADQVLALARDFVQPFGVAAEERLIVGPPADAIAAAARECAADMVAVGAHGVGASFLGRLLAGSTALALLAEAPAAVLLVPPTAADTTRLPALCSILVPTDGSRASMDAAELAAGIAVAAGAPATLLYCEEEVVPEGFARLALTEAERDEAARGQEPLGRLILHATQEAFLRRKHPVDLLHVSGSPSEEILRAALEGGFSLIAMGSYGAGEGILRRARIGSVTEAVLASAPCPVVVCKRPAGESPST